MQNFSYFMDFFGNITVKDVALFVAAVAFLIACYRKISDYLMKRHDAEKLKGEQLTEALEAVRKYPEYRQQSIAVQQKLEKENAQTREMLKETISRLTKIEEDSKRRERNKCRDRLLQNFRYFSSKEKNPMLAWTRMESESFWELFKDYEEMDGDGYVHTDVQPAMNQLEIIEMDDKERVVDLMHSRG